jgi:type IV secretory pathway VirB4 component
VPHLQLRVIEKTDFEQRIAKLETQLNRLKDQLQDPQVKAWREEERQKRNDEASESVPRKLSSHMARMTAKSLINIGSHGLG